jgi:hypothetical protein
MPVITGAALPMRWAGSLDQLSALYHFCREGAELLHLTKHSVDAFQRSTIYICSSMPR